MQSFKDRTSKVIVSKTKKSPRQREAKIKILQNLERHQFIISLKFMSVMKNTLGMSRFVHV